MYDVADGRCARRAHLLHGLMWITVRVCHSTTGAQVAAVIWLFKVNRGGVTSC
jgi:hypothetical protein